MTPGLRFPDDLAAWHRWQASRHRARQLRNRFRREEEPPVARVYRNSDRAPDIVVSIAATTASAKAALFAPLAHAGTASLAVVSDQDLGHLLPGWQESPEPWQRLVRGAGAILGDGHYLALSHEVWALARAGGVPYFVSQHGAITPLAPPLPPSARLLSWSDDDGRFWPSGRPDITSTTVGSQLLWEAARAGNEAGTASADSITYAGQLHGAELPRSRMTRAAFEFCRGTGAHYRPHPSERDRISRVSHAAFKRAGITFDTSQAPLAALTTPLVSVFSTSTLEAAALGRDAWVDYPHPPPWLTSFWARYGMARWGDEPTPAPSQPSTEPAVEIMRVVLDAV